MPHQLERAVRRRDHHVVLVLARADAPLLGATQGQVRRNPWLGLLGNRLVDGVDDADGGGTDVGMSLEAYEAQQRKARESRLVHAARCGFAWQEPPSQSMPAPA